MRECQSRVIVLDDDPTGSQAASGVRVLLRPDLNAVRRWLTTDERALYVVTNTRSMSESRAVDIVSSFTAGVASLGAEHGVRLVVIQRGDSTLRGHVRAEIDCVATADAIVVFVPAYPDGGRVTLAGTHYVRSAHEMTPVAQTEFAADPVFGYRESYLPDWLASHLPGRPVRTIPLAVVRDGPAAVFTILVTVTAGTVVVPDAETRSDIETIAAAVAQFEQSGRPVVLRGAAAVAAARAGVQSGGYLSPDQPRRGATLVVCGSHTQASTRQVRALCSETGVNAVELPAHAARVSHAERKMAGDRLAHDLDTRGFALLTTARTRPADLATLDDGAAVMRRLTAVAASVSDRVGACVVKGGITSADIAADSFGASEGFLVGQLEPGVSLWRLSARHRDIDYVVVPGNMGDDRTLIRSLQAVTAPADALGAAS